MLKLWGREGNFIKSVGCEFLILWKCKQSRNQSVSETVGYIWKKVLSQKLLLNKYRYAVHLKDLPILFAENLKYCAVNDYVAIHIFGRERESGMFPLFWRTNIFASGIGIDCLTHLYIFILNDLYGRFFAYSLS